MTDKGGVAFSAHVGGFVTGILLVWVLRRRRVVV
jgi:membrane associated rhomboid family serine protease